MRRRCEVAGFTLSARDTERVSLLIDLCEGASDQPATPLPVDAVQAFVELFRLDLFSLNMQSLRDGSSWCQQEWEAQGAGAAGTHLLLYPVIEPGLAQDPRYFTTGCSLPERRGDFDTVYRGSDVPWTAASAWLLEEQPWLRQFPSEMTACALLPGAHQLRILGWRAPDVPDFSDRELFLVRLLRPHLVHATSGWRRDHPCAPSLTPRQRELMAHVRDGESNRQIARKLHLSEATVRTHLSQIYSRLGVSSRTAAVGRVFDTV